MKEQWTQDLKHKLSDYEVPTIPEGLWEDIDAAMPEAPQKANRVALFPHWRKVCAAILLLIAIPTSLFFLHNKEDEQIVAEIEKHAPIRQHVLSEEHLSLAQATIVSSPNTSAPTVSISQRPKPIAVSENYHIEENSIEDNHVEESKNEENTDTQSSKEISVTENNKRPTPSATEQNKTTTKETIASVQNESLPNTKKSNGSKLSFAFSTLGSSLSMDHTNQDMAALDGPVYGTEGTPNEDYNDWTGHWQNKTIEEHDRPIIIGVEVGIPVADALTLATGLSYTYLHSEIGNIDQQLHFVGVPMQINYQLYKNRHISLYLGAGGKVDFGAKGKTNIDNNLRNLPVNYSLRSSAGLQLRLFKGLNIYAEPSLQYNIPGSTRYKTYYTNHKTMFDTQIGFRWMLE